MSVCSECAAEQPTAIPVGLSHSASLARLILTVPDSSSLSLDIPPSLAPEPPDAGSPDGGLTAACRTLAGQGTLSRQLQTRRLLPTPVPIGYCARKRRFSYFRIEQSSTRPHVARAHNHPSGDPDPSSEDRVLTARLRQAGELLGITLLDHIILGDERTYSFADHSWPCA